MDKPGFRADVEGLRALAVLAILIFHVDHRLSPGGFAGVDIFFVISGYLITRQIAGQGGNFRFGEFYLRRARRLGPALIATVLASLLAGWFLLSPVRYTELAQSALASLFGVANIYFYLTQDYFSGSNLTKPLLHIWSLSLEEQFYALWPALLVLLARWRLSAIVVTGVVSLAASIAISKIDSAASFYLVPFRIFEFALGAIVAVHQPAMRRRLSALSGGAGLALMLASLVALNEHSSGGGFAALLPTAGAALFIAAGPQGLANRLVANPLFRSIGRASYSIYLVHWPIIAFFAAWRVTALTLADAALLFFASLIAGYALHYSVERPLRTAPLFGLRFLHARWTRLRVPMLPAAAAFAVAGIFAFSIIWNDGIPRRVAKSKAQQPGQLSFAGDICNARRSRCAFGDPDSSRIVYLVGDSYAMNLAYGLDVLFAKNGYRGIALFDSGCAFLRDTVTYVKSAPDRRCEENVAATYAQLARDRHPIIFASHYTGYRTILAPKGGQPSDPAESDFAPWFVDRLQADLAAIGGQDRRLIVFKQSYNVGVDLPNCLARPNADISACAARRGDEMRRLSVPFDTALANMQRIFPSLVLVDSKSAFCPTDGTCIVSEGSTLFFRDSAHLTNEGSRFAIDRLSGPILSALQTSPY